MIGFLKILYVCVLSAMLAVTVTASLQENILKIPESVRTDPWFIATLFDAYFGFMFFFLWVCYKETSVVVRVIWFFLIAILGNIAMAIYMLIQLFRLPSGASLCRLILNEKDGGGA
jgi:predicted permease